jgi:hypothetical protein
MAQMITTTMRRKPAVQIKVLLSHLRELPRMVSIIESSLRVLEALKQTSGDHNCVSEIIAACS